MLTVLLGPFVVASVLFATAFMLVRIWQRWHRINLLASLTAVKGLGRLALGSSPWGTAVCTWLLD